MPDAPGPQVSEQSLSRYQSRAPELLKSVREISVLDDESYKQICEYKLAAAEALKTLATITGNIKRTHKAALEAALIPWDRIIAPLTEAMELAEQKRKTYVRAQEIALAAKQAEALTQQRAQAEAQRASNAELLAAAGHAAAAEAVRSAPLDLAPPTLPPAVPKVKGIRNAKTWKVKITDKKLFLRAIGAQLLLSAEIPLTRPARDMLRIEAGDVPSDAYFCLFDADGDVANMHWLRDRARQQKEAFSFPGVSAWQE